jgi:hypothetical protein
MPNTKGTAVLVNKRQWLKQALADDSGGHPPVLFRQALEQVATLLRPDGDAVGDRPICL